MFTKTVKKMEAYRIGKNRRKNYTRFTILERGKKRDISAPHIEDRQPDKLITKEIITPIYRSHAIYDNGASTVGKGFHFAIARLKKMLSEHYKKYGTEGGVLLLDIKGYFPNAQHTQIKRSHDAFFPDENVKEVLWSYVEP